MLMTFLGHSFTIIKLISQYLNIFVAIYTVEKLV